MQDILVTSGLGHDVARDVVMGRRLGIEGRYTDFEKTTQMPRSILKILEASTNLIIGVGLLIVFAVFLFVAWQKWSAQSPSDYEGRIIDRWADDSGPAQGYQPRLSLVVESADKKQFTVNVEPHIYESAKIGMRITSRSGKIVLIDSERDAIRK